jgi:hypothetical protein
VTIEPFRTGEIQRLFVRNGWMAVFGKKGAKPVLTITILIIEVMEIFCYFCSFPDGPVRMFSLVSDSSKPTCVWPLWTVRLPSTAGYPMCCISGNSDNERSPVSR